MDTVPLFSLTRFARLWPSYLAFHLSFTVQEPPLEWLMKMNRRGFLVYCVVGMLNYGIRSVASILFTGSNIDAFGLAALSVLHLRLRQTLQLKCCPRKQHQFLVFVACCCIAVYTWAVIWHPDPVFRHRSMGMAAVAWRVLVPIFGLTTKPCATIVLVGTISEWGATYTTLTMHGETAAIARVFFMLLLASLADLGWCCVWISWWATHYNTLKQMEIEMEASQSILAMVCDATFWIAADGTFVSPDYRLESIFGQRLVGKNLSDFLLRAEAERFHTFLGGSHGTPKSHVSLLPITFARSQDSATSVNAELFVVDRRQAFNQIDEENACPTWAENAPLSSVKRQRGFLIGLRLEPYCEQTMKPSDAALEATTDATVESATSVAEIASLRCGLPPAKLGLQSEHQHATIDVKTHSDSINCGAASITSQSGAYRICVQEPLIALEPDLVSRSCLTVDLKMRVLCEVSNGCFALRAVADLQRGQRLLCMNCTNYECCLDVVQNVTPLPKSEQLHVTFDGCGELVRISARTRMLSKRMRDDKVRWRSLRQVLSSHGLSVKLLSLPNGAGTTKADPCWHKVAKTVSGVEASGVAGVQMRGGKQSAIYVWAGLSRFTALTAPVNVSFSDDGSSDMPDCFSAVTEHIEALPACINKTTHLGAAPHLDDRDAQDSLLSDTASEQSEAANFSPKHCEEEVLTKLPASWEPTSSYFEHCATALLEDLVRAANFSGLACCAWHHNLSKLASAVKDMHSLHRCNETWPPTPAVCQCATCQALIFELEDDGRCWVCQESLGDLDGGQEASIRQAMCSMPQKSDGTMPTIA